MANSYSAPNFNIDTDTNIAGLIALKGGAPSGTDYIYTYNGATVTAEQNFSAYQISLGETSSGAAGAGNRYGHYVQDAGVTYTTTGDPANTSSGIKCNPVSADSSSKQSSITFNGTSGSYCVITNSVGAKNTSYRYTLYMQYGSIVSTSDYLEIKYCGQNAWYAKFNQTYASASEQGIQHLKINDALENGQSIIIQTTAADGNCDCKMTYGDFTPATTGSYFWFNGNNVACPDLDYSGLKLNENSSGQAYLMVNTPKLLSGSGSAYANGRISYTDIRPTEVVPTTFTLTDVGDGDSLDITWSNGVSYGDNDMICVFDSSISDPKIEDAMTIVPKASTGTGRVCGLTTGTPYTLKLAATSDGTHFSGFSNTDTETPTSGTAPTFAGIDTVVNNFDGSLSLGWVAATGVCDHYEIHVHTASMTDTDLNNRDYVVASKDFGETTAIVKYLSDDTPFDNGDTIYVRMRAFNGITYDSNSAEESEVVVNSLQLSRGVGIYRHAPYQLTASNTTIFTCPAGVDVDVLVQPVNTDESSARAVTLYKVIDGDAAATDIIFEPTTPLSARGTSSAVLPHRLVQLTPGDSIQGYADAASKVNVHFEVLARTRV